MRKKTDESESPLRTAGFSPTRFEYFAGLALQGLLVGRSEKDWPKMSRRAVEIAKTMEDALDS